mgnify:CR=1 FL=1
MKNKSTFYIILIISLCLISCNSNKVLFSDNFEAYTTNKFTSNIWKVEGDVTVDTTKMFYGKQSIRFKSGEGYANRAFITLQNPILTNIEAFYGALKMYVKEASPDGIHWTMIQVAGKTPRGFYAEVRYGGQYDKRLMANYDTKGIKTDCWHHTVFKIPEKKWFSVQWYMNRKSNNMKLWIEGILVHELNANNLQKGCLNNENNQEWTFPKFELLTLGWVDYQTNGGEREVWIDDVKLSTTMIK